MAGLQFDLISFSSFTYYMDTKTTDLHVWFKLMLSNWEPVSKYGNKATIACYIY